MKTMKVLSIVMFATLLLTACDNGGPIDRFMGIKSPTATAEPTVTSTQVPATALCAAQATAEPATCVQPTATAFPATAKPTATSAPKCTGYTMLQETDFGHKPGDPIFRNMDVGDDQMIAVVEAWDRSDPNTAFIAIIDRGYNLDFENATIAGTYRYFEGNLKAVSCRANELWEEMGGNTYRLYVGNHTTPAGWSKMFPGDWTMKVWTFTTQTIDVPGAIWNAETIQVSSDHTFGGDNWTYGQLWDGMDSGTVYHFIVAPCWKVTSPKYQGTVWTTSNVTFETVDLLIMRFSQMSSEVLLRDDGPTVNMYYCGSAYLQPSGWNTVPSGWTCTKQT